MVHLAPLPGSPLFAGSLEHVVTTAVSDSETLAASGFPALLVENFGDVPFHGDRVDPITVAAMTVAVQAVQDATGLPIGVNVLRNDAFAALGIAAATGARFIRVNVLTGVMYTDQGPLVGPAAELMRRRARLDPNIEVWADLMVKHAVPPPALEIGPTAADLDMRGLADAILVSGGSTGEEPGLEEMRQARSSIDKSKPLVVGSGATPDNLATLMDVADGVVVGSSLKFEGDPRRLVDPSRAATFIGVARDLGLL